MKKSLIVWGLFLLILIMPFTMAVSGGFFYKVKNFFGKSYTGEVITGNAIHPECIETDSGRDILVKGDYPLMKVKPYDYCNNNYVLHESYCNPDAAGYPLGSKAIYVYENIPCAYGCVDGACVCPEGAEYPCEYDENIVKYTFNPCYDLDSGVSIIENELYTYAEAKAVTFSKNALYQSSRYVKGTTTGIYKGQNEVQTFIDVCANNKVLTEYGCNYMGSQPKFYDAENRPGDLYVSKFNQLCPYGCKDGSCIETKTSYSCTKTDKITTSIYDAYYQGKLVENDVLSDQQTDYCFDSQKLVTYSCYPPSYVPAAGKIKTAKTLCKYGCSEGACLSADNSKAVVPGLVDGWTPWYNLDDPSDGSDMEYHTGWNILPDGCQKIIGIECQTINGEGYRKTGEVVSCDKRWGLYCKAQNQQSGACLNDYQVRYQCQVSTQ